MEIAITNTRWPLGFLVKREKKRAIPGKRKTKTRRPSQIRGQASNDMVNPNSTNIVGLWHKMREMAKEIVGARKLGRKNIQTKLNSKRGTRASVV